MNRFSAAAAVLALLLATGLPAQAQVASRLAVTADSTALMPLRDIARIDLAQGERSYRWYGAAAGLVVGGTATWIILNSGGSTAPCDRDANPDAMSAGECLAITAAGAVAGAGIGYLIGGLFHSRPDAPFVRVGWRPRWGARLALELRD